MPANLTEDDLLSECSNQSSSSRDLAAYTKGRSCIDAGASQFGIGDLFDAHRVAKSIIDSLVKTRFEEVPAIQHI